MQICINKENNKNFGAGRLTMPSDKVFFKTLTRHNAKKLSLKAVRNDLYIETKADDFDISIIPHFDNKKRERTVSISIRDSIDKALIYEETFDAKSKIRGVDILLKVRRTLNPIIQGRFEKLVGKLFPPGHVFESKIVK